MRTLTAILTIFLLAACSGATRDTTVSPNLESGITSSNGGGQRALGNTNSMGVTTSTTPAK